MERPKGWGFHHIFNRKVRQERKQGKETSLQKPAEEEYFDYNIIDTEKPTEYAQLEIFHRAVYPSKLYKM